MARVDPRAVLRAHFAWHARALGKAVDLARRAGGGPLAAAAIGAAGAHLASMRALRPALAPADGKKAAEAIQRGARLVKAAVAAARSRVATPPPAEAEATA